MIFQSDVLKTRTQSWYYSSMYPGYKARRSEFRELFSGSSGKFVVDYSCAYHKDILHQGRLYVTTESLCFYSYIFGWENKISVLWQDVTSITKEKTAIFIPNAIQFQTSDNQKYFFASFVDRDSSYMMLVKLWQAVTSHKLLTDDDIDQLIACEYGEGEDEVIDDESAFENDEQEKKKSNDQDVSKWLLETDGDVVIDQSFSQFSLTQLFQLIYSNDNFYFNFQKERGTTELDIGEWEQRDGSAETKIREVSYNMELNNPVGPKTCQVKETQMLKEVSLADGGKMICIDTEADNSGLPYADSFSVVTHSCLLEDTSGGSRLVAVAEIRFKRDLWGFLKDKIENNARTGIKDYYQSLVSSLINYSDSEPQQASLKSKNNPKQTKEPSSTSNHLVLDHPWLISFIMIVLLISSVINTFILFRLSTLSSSVVYEPAELELSSTHHLPSSEEEWIDLVRQQSENHARRVNHVKQHLQTASHHISSAHAALNMIKQTLEEWEPFDWISDDNCDENNCDKKVEPSQQSPPDEL